MRCPTSTTRPDGSQHTIVGCGSTDLSEPDDEGNCGVFFKPDEEGQ